MIISHWALVSVSGPAQFSHSPVTGVTCSTACPTPLQNIVMQLSLSPSSGGKLAARDAKKSTAAVSPGPGPATDPDQKPGLASLNNHQTSQSDICVNTVTELIHLHMPSSVFAVHPELRILWFIPTSSALSPGLPHT